MVKFNTKINKTIIKSDELNIALLSSGDIYEIFHEDIRVNLLAGNILDGSISNLYLRKKEKNQYTFKKLLGVKSNSVFEVDGNHVIYEGKALDVNYQVVLTLENGTWYYDIFLEKNHNKALYDIIYVQDVSGANKGMLQSSESYAGQYVDHRVFKDEYGHTTLSRQNQGVPNLVQIGCFDEAVSYSTDGFQFYGKEYKETNIPQALLQDSLANENYQYEFPLIALQVKPFTLNENKHITFYGHFVKNQKEILKDKIEVPKIVVNRKEIKKPLNVKTNISFGAPITGLQISRDEIYKNYKNIRHEEVEDNNLLAFFADEFKHIVTKEKELMVERPHGHIIISGDLKHASENVFSSTSFMYGVFSSHVVIGNTNFHKLSGDVRNMLNVQKLDGQRIYLKKGDTYHLLTMPSYFEVNGNLVKWFYQLHDDLIEINYYSEVNSLQQSLTFNSHNKKSYDFIVTSPVIMGDRSNVDSIDFVIDNNEVTFTSKNNPFIQNHYPNLKYKYISSKNCLITDDSYIFGDRAETGMLIFKYEKTSDLKIDLLATLDDYFQPQQTFNLDKLIKDSNKFYKEIVPLSIIKSNSNKITSFNDLSFWYVHNALVHYASPHGLEQFSGAAWGTRDVVQGPFELFMVGGHYDISREILLKTFSRQFIETGDFPQWFMFDKYYRIQAHDSHGDIVAWPIKALLSYLEATNDLTILNEEVPFMSLELNNFTKDSYSINDHINKVLDRLIKSKVKEVNLPSYGGGDWNDTLQPANQELTEKMVSTWTVSLLYQSLSQLSNFISNQSLKAKMNKYTNDLYENYNKYLVVDNIPTGFTIFDNNKTKVLLHPKDNETGINYRLLSLQRSIISEIADKDNINLYYNIFNQELKHNDGMRLMNKVITYQGGKNEFFVRAETAANFGREVGLLYVHAHIRYIEAMAKIGAGEDVLWGLTVINPINIKKHVTNAIARQSNTYFSSSDGNFNDRYIAMENFDKLKSGDVGVKAGWRVYSSGPGIFLNQLISNAFGIKKINNELIIDPCLSKEFNNTTIKYIVDQKEIIINYHVSKETRISNNLNLEIVPLKNKYKDDSYLVKGFSNIKEKQLIIDVFYKD